MLFRADISNPPLIMLIYEDVTGLVHQCFVDGNRPEAFFVLIYNRIWNTCDLRTIINTVGQLLLKLIRYKHRLMLFEPRITLFLLSVSIYQVYVMIYYQMKVRFKIMSYPPIPHPYLPYPPSSTKKKPTTHTINNIISYNNTPPPPPTQTHKHTNYTIPIEVRLV